MKTFKEYCENKIFNERAFCLVPDINSEATIPVYINPSPSDIELLAKTSQQIRGLTKGRYVFVWDSFKLGHYNMSKNLGDYDNELSQLSTDICFYLDVKSRSPLELDLSYSSWTGAAADDKLGSRVHIKRLTKHDGMQKILPLIKSVNGRNPEELDHHPDWNKSIDPEMQKQLDLRQSEKSKPSSIAAYERSAAVKPYRWQNQMHRIGD